MRRFLLLLACVSGTARATPPPDTNLLTLGAGAVVVRADVRAETAGAVALDGSARTLPIGTPKREPLPLTFVVELPAATAFSRFEVPEANDYGNARGRHVAKLRIEGSATSPDDGFTPVLEATLAQGVKGKQRFDVPAPVPVRWLRVTFLERHAPAPSPDDPHRFTELEGYGTPAATPAPVAAFNGRWRYRRKGLNDAPGVNIVELVQRGSNVQGCQRIGGKQTTIAGSIVDGLARLVAEDDKGKRTPFTARVLSDGQLAGVDFEGPPRAFYAAPDAAAEAPCKAPPPANPVADALASGATATLYGIHFDVDSDVLRADAEPALQQLLEALEGAPSASVTIEGHTDWDGSDAHNADLSERRAKAVVAWLVARRIAPARLVAVGRGEAEPIADNESSAGRALNRRVEVEPRR